MEHPLLSLPLDREWFI